MFNDQAIVGILPSVKRHMVQSAIPRRIAEYLAKLKHYQQFKR